MTKPVKPATWTLALRDEPMWREMGCPTMGTALRRIKDLEARVLRLTVERERALNMGIHAEHPTSNRT